MALYDVGLCGRGVSTKPAGKQVVVVLKSPMVPRKSVEGCDRDRVEPQPGDKGGRP